MSITFPSDAILARILSLHPKVIDLSLDRMHRILTALGHPERKLPPVIHIAGTNGKGSTQAMIRAGLEAMGKTVHSYTSPHLARFHERIYLAGNFISDDFLTALLEEAETVNDGAPITFFEMTTAVAFMAFSRTHADYLILEVGLGGRLDATNVITPELSVITPISLDHEAYLGDTIDAIAGEKAGIIKDNVPVICGIQDDITRQVIEEKAAQCRAPIRIQNQDFQTYEDNGRLVFQDDEGLMDLSRPALLGRHQIDNAAMAIAALKALGADEGACESAMQNVTWPARMQRLKFGPLVDAAKGAELWLDGGHNPAAGEMIADFLSVLPPKPLTVICGMLNTKDVSGYLRFLAPFIDHFYGVSIPGEAATLSADEIVATAKSVGINAEVSESAQAAINSMPQDGRRVLICGSLYLAGRVLRENG